jgi:L-aminopeptidase/D-esterase-like protein
MSGDDPYQVWWGELRLGGVTVGTAGDERTGTGVTVVLFSPGATGSVEVAGGGPATRETDALYPDRLVPGPDAVMLAGGSAFGLAAADGVMKALWEAGRGFPAGPHRVPIVAAACLFDLEEKKRPPGPEMGREAAERALAGGRRTDGRLGAGAGARVGRGPGGTSMPSGQAAVTLVAGDDLAVGALVVVNALGSVRGEDGTLLAGPRDPAGHVVDVAAAIAAGRGVLAPEDRTHTTLGVVVTNARLDKGACRRVARMAHDGLARAIDPVHTLADGDAIFAVSVGDGTAGATRVGTLAAHAVAMAVRRAVTVEHQTREGD